MKIAVVSPISPVPPHGGTPARIHNLIKEMEEAGHEVHLVLISRRSEFRGWEQGLRQVFGTNRLHWFRHTPAPARLSGRLNWALRRIGIKFRKSWRVSGEDGPWRLDGNFDARVIPGIRRLDGAERYDAAVVIRTECSGAFEAFRPEVLRVIDTNDLQSGRGTRFGATGIQFADYWLTPEEETRGLLRCDVVVAIQREEAETFSRMVPPDLPVRTLGHMIEPRPLALAHRPAASFLASAFSANNQAWDYFRNAVLPLIVAKRPGFVIHLAGSLSKEVAPAPGIVPHGIIPDVAELFALGPVMVNPMRAGAGQAIKMMDAMAMGVPVVTTRTGARGFAPADLRGARVVGDDDPQGFAEAVLGFMDDEAEWGRAAAAQTEAARAWQGRQRAALADILSLPVRAQRGA